MPSLTSVGFTGTRHKVNIPQLYGMRLIFNYVDLMWHWHSSPIEFHHGDCINADVLGAREAKLRNFFVVAHPPLNEVYRAFSEDNDICKEPKEYIDRNHDIVDSSRMLIAVPGTMHEVLRSGTWATVRYARKLERPIYFAYPDGSTKLENRENLNTLS